MASTHHAIASISLALQRRWWMQWVLLYAIPLLFFFLGRLVALTAILDMVASHDERTASAKAAGVLLGTIQDLLATTLLVASLVLVDFLGVTASRALQPRVHDRLLTTLVLRRVGQLARFLAAFTLASVWLAIVAADLLLVCTRQIRLTTTYDPAPSEDLDHYRRDVFYSVQAIVGVGGVSLFLAGLFTWVVNLSHWAVSASSPEDPDRRGEYHESIERTRISSSSRKSSEYVTPTYHHASFVVFPFSPTDDGALRSPDALDSAIERHVTIVSATGDVDEYHAPEMPGSLSLTQPIASKKPRLRTRRHRLLAGGVTGVAIVLLIASVTLAIARSASPVVASIALNATLNKIVRGVVGIEFLPDTRTR